MSRFIILFTTVLLRADQVVLTNGDRITGKVIKKDGGSLVMKADLFGDVTIKWETVQSIATTEPVAVALPGGETVRGTVETTGGKLRVAGPSGPREAPLAQVSTVRNAAEQAKYERYLRPPITDLWAGFIDLGLATAQGNAETLTFTTALNAARITSHDNMGLHFNQIYSRGVVGGSKRDTAKAVRGGWTYSRNITPRLFVNVFNDYENDAFQNLDLRFVLGGGLGWRLMKREKGQLGIVSGGSFARENYSVFLPVRELGDQPSQTRRAGEAYIGDDFSYKLTPRSSLVQSFRMFNNLSRTGEDRLNFDLGAETKVMRWLSWQITASDRYITDPAPGRKKNDLLLSSGIRVSFAR